jgi:nucleotide-binding universal stress UspA family protein
MYRSVLVPLDGSAFAEHALPLALSIARRAGATLHLVQVHVLYPLQEPACGWLPFNPTLDVEVKEQERAYLAGVVKRLAAGSAVPVTSTLTDGLIVDGILEQVRAQKADLIVMTTHGQGPLTRLWLGSTADALIRLAPSPVLLARPQEGAPDLAREPDLAHVLIPLDGSELAEQVLPRVVALGRLRQAEYTLLRVIESPVQSRRLPTQALAEAQAYLDPVGARLRAEGLIVQTRAVFGRPVASALLEEARQEVTDLIALATHGRGGFKRLLLGSVADKVLRGATVPVLIYRPTLMEGGGPGTLQHALGR